eukprot:1834095-Rhodomonas_salina.1
MTSIYELAARDVFRCLEEEKENATDEDNKTFAVTAAFYELSGEVRTCFASAIQRPMLLPCGALCFCYAVSGTCYASAMRCP